MKRRYLLTFAFFLSVISSAMGKSGHSRPDAVTIKSLETITLFYKVTDQGLELSWSPANVAPSGGIKITMSDKNRQPLYPYDGYIKWMPGVGHQSCVIPLSKVTSDKVRYLRICSVNAKNHSHYEALSNVVVLPPIARHDARQKQKEKRTDKSRHQPTTNKATSATSAKVSSKAKKHSSSSAKAPARNAEKKGKVISVRKPSGGLIIGHKNTNIDKIPAVYLMKAKENLSVWYGHTSHGSQITSGIRAMNRPPYTFNRNGSGGALQYVEVGGDLGHRGNLAWAKKTRRYLESGGTANVIMWSWCGGCSDNTPEGIKAYLKEMSQLEKDYPNRIFVYMTGHLDGSGKNGRLNKNNNQIRDYCRKYKKVLYDFADIESYDPDGNYYLDLMCRDSCDYVKNGVRKNWAADWVKNNPNHGIALPNRAAHTHPLNGALKGRAFWVMMARLAGWPS